MCSDERTTRALERLALPIRLKGAGITSVALRHPIAYFASVAVSAAVDPGLAKHIMGLERFAEDTHARLLSSLGPASRLTDGIEDLIARASPNVLLNPAYFVDLLLKRDDKNIQKPLTRVAHTLFARGGGTCADMDLWRPAPQTAVRASSPRGRRSQIIASSPSNLWPVCELKDPIPIPIIVSEFNIIKCNYPGTTIMVYVPKP